MRNELIEYVLAHGWNDDDVHALEKALSARTKSKRWHCWVNDTASQSNTVTSIGTSQN